MKKLSQLGKDERSLLLYLETRCVDHGGKVDTDHMNDVDLALAEQWAKDEFIKYGRIIAKHCTANGTNWCQLSDNAWALAAEERRARALRMWTAREWMTTDEKRAKA